MSNTRRSTNVHGTGNIPGRRDVNRGAASRRSGRRANASDGRLPNVRDRLPPQIKERISDDPLFQITTSNRSHWIDPFNGAAIPLPADEHESRKAVVEHLLASDSWRRDSCLDMATLRTQCWRLELRRLLPLDKRFRLFSSRDGLWMNPFNGNLVDEVHRPDTGNLQQATINAMARHLAMANTAVGSEPLSPDILRQAMAAINRDRNDARSSVFAPIDADESDHERDLERATQVQARMLQEPPEITGFQIARAFKPHAAVSGDAYDMYVDNEGVLHFLIADVAGHGIQGAIIAAGLLRTVRLLRRQINDPRELLIALNAELRPELLPGQFVTVCAGTLNPQDHVLQICLAGHHPCLVINPNADIMLSRLGQPGMVVGVAEGDAFANTLSIEELVLSPGDMVVQFTDGVFEASNDKGQEYGLMRLATRLLRRRACGSNANTLLQETVASVERFCGGRAGDDLTMIAIASEAG
ncbi:MAG: serine/threonine-protein phosphatase [Planctomycetota bacterium]|nr:MAG: serine/threonine-protein phosphatase [Planctomycetota bacterium]